MVCSKNRKLIIGILIYANIFAWLVVFDLTRFRNLEVVFFDVGQGDAAFIETPNRHQVLIDGGPDSTILEKLAKEMPFYDRTIDLVILSHPERDHMAGLLEVLKRYRIKNILWTGVKRDTDEWREWQYLIKKEGAEVEIAEVGERIILEEPNIFIDILNPSEKVENKELENSNNTSIVAYLTVGENSFLFTGDISGTIERKINIDIDVLKVAHHASKYSTSEEFLKNISPLVAVISVGENNYGHPTQEVLARLNKFGIDILRTDKNGDIKILSDAKNLKLITNK